ncbi:37059_t:CDS:10 [Gigaspora margarita]|uniref:37059_t:CDS:1 n=1 Tax=Gigaspora margarita TaxID=4874 RepID=A0ABN7UCU9_GIGMA|nr:37059_t:CDS:10 [Gigaspora margarita]
MDNAFIKSIQDKKIKDSNSITFEDDKNNEAQIIFDEKSIKRTEFVRNNAHVSRKHPIYIEFYGVNYSIPIPRKKVGGIKTDEEIGKNPRQTIIQDIHGFARPGEILAILGPSGCGKTTLLNALSGRLSTKDVEGTIKMNGYQSTKDLKRFIAYCTQEDIFFPHLTSRLRLPREVPISAKLEQVENVIQALNLSKCSNTKIGDIKVRGISGGEKKRVSIANELLTDPSVILLDEPTSGLALELVQTLKEFAVKQKKTIIMVIHQPSSQVFELFDRLLVMADGHVVYFGDGENIVDYLANEGFVCRPNFNPADYMLEILNDSTIKQKLITAYKQNMQSDSSGKLVVEKCYKSSTNPDDSIILESSKYKWEATFFQQLMILTERSFKQRSKVILSKLNFTQVLCIAILTSLIWFQLPYTEANLMDRCGLILETISLKFFVSSRNHSETVNKNFNVLRKERQSRSYRLLAYFLSKQIAELPLIIIFPIYYILIVYWTTGLVPSASSFFAYMATSILATLTSQSFGYLIGATFMDIQAATMANAVIMLGSLVLGGFYAQNLPFGLSWLKYLSFMFYSYSITMEIQFNSPYAKFQCSNISQTNEYSQCLYTPNGSSDGYIQGVTVLEHLKLNVLPWYANLLILIGLSLIIRSLAYFSLRRNSNKR